MREAWPQRAVIARDLVTGERRYHGNGVPDSKMADSVQVEEPQRRAVGGTITTGRIHKGRRVKIGQFLGQNSSCKTKIEISIQTGREDRESIMFVCGH